VFSRDGKWLASASGDKSIKLWDAQSGQELFSLEGHNRWVAGVHFSPDGKRLASAGADGVIRLWDTSCGQELVALKGHVGIVSGITFSPNGDLLASSGYDGTIRIINSHEWTPLLRIEQEARDLIEFFRETLTFKTEVVESIRRDTSVNDEVRQAALKMTQSWIEDLND
jgi:WD40 repeat protein